MTMQNTAEKFGSLTKLLHWSIFLLFIVEFYLVYRREYFPKDSAEKLQYIILHKSFGICVLILTLLMIVFHQLGTRPKMPTTMSLFEVLMAKTTHLLLYAVMLIQPITGIMMSSLGGYPISFFWLFDLPNFFQKNERLADVLYTTHVWSSYFIIGLVALHTLAALYHHFCKKDVVLKRMLPTC